MKKIKWTAYTLVLVLTAALWSCTQQNTAAKEPAVSVEAPTPATMIDPTLDLEFTKESDGHFFVVTSNLPDGTEILVSLSKGSFENKNYKDLGGQSASLSNGKIRVGPFRNKKQIHEPGNYTVSVTVPVIINQPESVKKILGNRGENLAGLLVKKYELAGDFISNVVEKEFSVKF